jgi:hypothetical protein
MVDVESYRQHAADCLRRAQNEEVPEDKNILLNVALAWLRLAHQTQAMGLAAPADVDATERESMAEVQLSA